MINISLSGIGFDLDKATLNKATEANKLLHSQKGKGSDFLGWVELPTLISESEIEAIESTAAALRHKADVVICIGIGGSYLGAKAVIDSLGNPFESLRTQHHNPTIVYAGNNISEDYLHDLIAATEGHSLAVIVISKSGTTTEPAIAFRIIRQLLEQRYGRDEARQRIVAVTDQSRGALFSLAKAEGYPSFVIPDNVGGRYSVLTPVGLLPIAVAGIDIRAIIDGARTMQRATGEDVAAEDNIAIQYAAARNALYERGKKIELLAAFEPRMGSITEWWKQLYGESEGKQGRGIFPASVIFSTDLHSMGQYIQQGERTLFESIISVTHSDHQLTVPLVEDDADGLNYIGGKRLSYINHKAEQGVIMAHNDGGVPTIELQIERADAFHIGALLYMFEKACGISGYMLDINPFDQPGVEAYKKNMFALLGKK